jgi:hypothetical protein
MLNKKQRPIVPGLLSIALIGVGSLVVVTRDEGHWDVLDELMCIAAQDNQDRGVLDETISGEKPFLDENHKTMVRMMADMDVKPTGDIDRDFVAMMVPHHQGAIDMATAVLRFGKNEAIRRLAQEIIVTQQEEIVAMRSAVSRPVRTSFATSAQSGPLPASRNPFSP